MFCLPNLWYQDPKVKVADSTVTRLWEAHCVTHLCQAPSVLTCQLLQPHICSQRQITSGSILQMGKLRLREAACLLMVASDPVLALHSHSKAPPIWFPPVPALYHSLLRL
jgi:hypothetical protein